MPPQSFRKAGNMLTIAHRSWKTDRLDFFSRFLFWIGGCSICLLPPTSCLCFWKQRMPKEIVSEGRLQYLWGKKPLWREEARQGNYTALTVMERFYLNAQQNASPAEAWAEAGEKPCHSVVPSAWLPRVVGRAWLGKPQQPMHQVTDSSCCLEVNC